MKAFARILAHASCLAFCLALTAPAAADDWVPVQEGSPNRFGHSMVPMTDGKVLMFGGEDANADLFNDLYLFEDEQWLQVFATTVPPEARRNHAAWEYEGKMYVSGGENSNQELLNDLWSFDPQTSVWEEIPIPENGPGARSRYGADVSENGTVVITGGLTSGGVPGHPEYKNEMSDTWTYSIAENTYEKKPDCPHPASRHKMYRYGDRYYILQVFAGGRKMFRLEGEGQNLQWTEIDQTGDVPDFAHDAFAVKLPQKKGAGKAGRTGEASEGAVLMGGYAYRNIEGEWDFEMSSDVWLFDFETEAWTRKGNLPFGLREAAAYFDAANGLIKVYGGLKADSTVNQDVWVYRWPTSGADGEKRHPFGFTLLGNYPDPFNPVTTIEYEMPVTESVRLVFFDSAGRMIATRDEGRRSPGRHVHVFDGSGLPSGVYYCRVETGGGSRMLKMALIK